MNNKAINELKEEEKIIVNLIKETKMLIDEKVCGNVRVSKSCGVTQFYLIEDGFKKGKYIRKENRHKAIEMVQQEYYRKFILMCEKRLYAVRSCINMIEKNELEDVYNTLAVGKKEIVKPIIMNDEQYISEWNSIKYEGKEFVDDIPEIYSEKGERVRSKSEKIIADKLLMEGIPYRYEYPIYIKGMGKVYPDFTLLNIRERKNVILEHFGMMDDQDYCNNAIRKIQFYQRSGMVMGVDLFITMESSNNPFDSRALDSIISLLK